MLASTVGRPPAVPAATPGRAARLRLGSKGSQGTTVILPSKGSQPAALAWIAQAPSVFRSPAFAARLYHPKPSSETVPVAAANAAPFLESWTAGARPVTPVTWSVALAMKN